MYYGLSFAPGSKRSNDEASESDGSDPFIGGFARNRDFDDLHEDQEHNPEVPQRIPLSDALCSENCTVKFKKSVCFRLLMR